MIRFKNVPIFTDYYPSEIGIFFLPISIVLGRYNTIISCIAFFPYHLISTLGTPRNHSKPSKIVWFNCSTVSVFFLFLSVDYLLVLVPNVDVNTYFCNDVF